MKGLGRLPALEEKVEIARHATSHRSHFIRIEVDEFARIGEIRVERGVG